jgi:transposase-like protein
VEDTPIACTDGLTGFPEAIRAVFPHTRVRLCIVHMLRDSTTYVFYKDLKKSHSQNFSFVKASKGCADLKAVYTAADEGAAREPLSHLAKPGRARSRCSTVPGMTGGALLGQGKERVPF